ncbi:MAG: hypothetical protein RJA70_1213 [Pseudomonadota bacterium]|jgi:hypothetical protein
MPWQFILKVALTTSVIIGVSELSKRSSSWGALLASLPLTSLLAFVWLYTDTGDTQQVARLARSIFWLVIASLPLLAILPALLDAGWQFWPSLLVSCLVTVGVYFALFWLSPRIGIQL